MLRQQHRLWACAMAVALLLGCGRGPTHGANPVAPASGGVEPARMAPDGKNLRPDQVKLVPLSPALGLDFQLLVPEGWPTFATVSKDDLQVQSQFIYIHVHTQQLRGRPAPLTVQDLRKQYGESLAELQDLQVTPLQVDGTVSAFELQYRYRVDSEERATLMLRFYGKTYVQYVELRSPANIFAEWKPLFRTIIQSFKHSNLDAEPLPGRP